MKAATRIACSSGMGETAAGMKMIANPDVEKQFFLEKLDTVYLENEEISGKISFCTGNRICLQENDILILLIVNLNFRFSVGMRTIAYSRTTETKSPVFFL